MRTARITIVCLTLSLVLAVSPVFGAEEETSGTESAGVIVKITVDPDILPLNPTTVDSLIRSPGVAGKAASETLRADDQTAARIAQSIRMEWLSQAMQSDAVSQTSDPYEAAVMEEQRRIKNELPMGSRRANEPSAEEPADRTSQSRPSRTDERRTRGRTNRSEDRTAAGMGSGGMGGGMSMGGMSGMMGSGGMGGGMPMGGMGYGMMGSGGMGGGMPMGGMGYGMMGGGMGGGGGGFGMGGMYGAPTPTVPTSGQQQTAMIKLSVQLPVGYRPRTGDFVKALIDNLEKVLRLAYDRYEHTLDEQIQFARFRRDGVERQLLGNAGPSSPESTRVQEQLNTIVDLSMLTPEMPFSEAIDMLKHSVEPPLPIVVLWKELHESCDIEPSTSIDMDGLPTVKLETALRTLLKAVGGGFSEISYQIDDDVIVIGEDQMPAPGPAFATLSVEADVRELVDRRRELSHEVQNLEMELASAEARREAIERQIAVTRREADQKLANDVVTRELKTLVDALVREEQSGPQPGDLAERSARKINLREQVVRAKIDLAKRKEEVLKSAGGGRLEDLNGELSQMAIETTERRARLDILRRQLDETQVQLGQASAFDPLAARLRAGRQALDIAEKRIITLTNRMVSLQPPTVTVIGADG